MDTIKKICPPVIRSRNGDLSKRWYVEYYTSTYGGAIHQRKYIYIKNYATAVERLQAGNTILYQLAGFPVQLDNLFFAKTLRLGAIQWRRATMRCYQTVVNSFSLFLGKKKPQSVTIADVNNYKIWLSDLGKSYNTIAKYNNVLLTVYNKAVELQLLESNPIVKLSNMRRHQASLQYFTESQSAAIKRYIQAADPQLLLCVQLLYYCFIRPGEMRSLKISAINFEMGYIEIPANISKNKKCEKVLIPAAFESDIAKLKDYNNDDYIISKTGYPSGAQVAIHHIYNQHKNALTELGITGRYSFYSWKHTGAVRSVQAGVNIRDLQNQLRHHSLDMVQIYLKNLGVLQSKDLKKRFPAL